MHLIVYTSDYIGNHTNIAEQLSDITATSKINNPKQHITGALFYHQGKFLQLIEGEQEQLEILMLRLEKDQRHNNIQRLIDEKIEARKLPEWNMDSLNLDKDRQLKQHELQLLTDVYKENLIVNTDAVLHFYKSMLKNRLLFKQDSTAN